MEAGWLLCALLCHGYLVYYLPVVHVFKDQILATNTVDFGGHFIALYTLTSYSTISGRRGADHVQISD